MNISVLVGISNVFVLFQKTLSDFGILGDSPANFEYLALMTAGHYPPIGIFVEDWDNRLQCLHIVDLGNGFGMGLVLLE